MKGFGKYWGWIVFMLLIVGWLTLDFGPVVLLALSGISAFYFFFNVPVWCGAEGQAERMPQQQSRGTDGMPPTPAQVAEAQNDLLASAVDATQAGAVPERQHQPRQPWGNHGSDFRSGCFASALVRQGVVGASP